jgi:hypothetical protein
MHTAKAKTGFKVVIRQKIHRNLPAAIEHVAKGRQTAQVEQFPEVLSHDGNCIPCAIWNLLPSQRDRIVMRLVITQEVSGLLLCVGHSTRDDCRVMSTHGQGHSPSPGTIPRMCNTQTRAHRRAGCRSPPPPPPPSAVSAYGVGDVSCVCLCSPSVPSASMVACKVALRVSVDL